MRLFQVCRSHFLPLCALLTILALVTPSEAQEAGLTKAAIEKIDQYLNSQTALGSFRGSVLIGLGGKIVFEKGFGFGDQEWGALNTVKTKFRIASLTKQSTGACVLLLQERGKLNVHDPVSKYVPDLPPAWRTVTLHQLLTHTSGIPNYPGLPRVEKVLNRTGATPRELIDLVADKPLELTPGTRLQYTNTGYILLGMVIEDVSGMSYAAFLQKNILTPLNMLDSGYDDAAEVLSQRAAGYMIKGGRIKNSDFIDMTIPFAAGGIYSTVEDMYRWNEALANGTLLSASSTTQMFTAYPETVLQGQHYGYGVVIAERFGRLLYYHGGGVMGFETVVQRYPKERLCIVVLENLDPTTPWQIGDHIAAELFNQPLPESK